MITILFTLLALVVSFFILGTFTFFVIALSQDIHREEVKHGKKTDKP